MTSDQILIFALLIITLCLFVWNRWRYDVVAVGALLAAGLTGLVPADDLFLGFGHPAVITVAAVLIISRGLLHAGVVDTLARLLTRVGDRPIAQIAALTVLVAVCSGFMNNVGALALLMPVAVIMSRRARISPGLLLMPLAFGSLLGGTMTMIGTPPNIIIASYRGRITGEPFGMFDFFPAGAGLTLAGVGFILLIGWRLTPRRNKTAAGGELFEVSDYLTEVLVTEDAKYAGKTLHELLSDLEGEADVAVTSRFRDGKRQITPSMYQVLKPGDILLISASQESLKALLDRSGLALAESEKAAETEDRENGADEESVSKKPSRKDLRLSEVIVTHESPLLGKSSRILEVRERHGLNILGVARRGHRLRQRIADIRFQVGDILLVQASEEDYAPALARLGCLPLAQRSLRLGAAKRLIPAVAIFGTALALTAVNLLPAATALVLAAFVMVLVGILSPAEACKSVDLPVLILLAAMIPVGRALETTGGAKLIAEQMAGHAAEAPLGVMIALLLLTTALLSNVVNNAAAAILAAPVAVDLAQAAGSNPDPFLMAVAVGASCAFLTPIGHQSNTLVMEPGGYRFGDYWRMGLPLTIVVTAAAVPLILWRFG
ncbi:MAG: SLC13 family permease [Verrucomicrobia bacterium]|nr:SLC13 family permease [Verrucomicrobiota bacterium]MCH8527373.1 SLC13 family permease [Kiritimatiellia bacterium]